MNLLGLSHCDRSSPTVSYAFCNVLKRKPLPLKLGKYSEKLPHKRTLSINSKATEKSSEPLVGAAVTCSNFLPMRKFQRGRLLGLW